VPGRSACGWRRTQLNGTAAQNSTSVNGSGARWAQLFQRLFEGRAWPAVNIDIHDFGATPGVVRLRLEQGFEEIAHD